MGNQNQLNTLLKTSETKKSHHHHEHFPCLSVACLISHQSARSLWSLWRRIHQSSAQEEHRRACLHQPQVLHTPGCCQGCSDRSVAETCCVRISSGSQGHSPGINSCGHCWRRGDHCDQGQSSQDHLQRWQCQCGHL